MTVQRGGGVYEKGCDLRRERSRAIGKGKLGSNSKIKKFIGKKERTFKPGKGKKPKESTSPLGSTVTRDYFYV